MRNVLRSGFLLAGLGWILAGCGSGPSSDLVALQTVEIREYQGENLSSVAGLPENSINGPQTVSLETYRLKVSGLVEKPLELTYEQVLAHHSYSKVVTLHCVEGWDATILWEGILISDLLDEAVVQTGAVIAIFHAADGYTSSLTLDYIRESKILLAYKMNGVTLPPERGFPFQVVAESKWGYKWVKWVTGIELSDDINYKGYWESRGYNNNGDQNGPMFAP
jgi:DMSO/TMAO reductase YedYZ molybdopterin-dependent catalytic subunit